MSDSKNIVIVGGSFAGLSSAHYFLRRIRPLLLAKQEKEDYKVVLINPSTHFYYRPGAPRAIADVSLLGRDKMFSSIADGFEQYGSAFEFHQGTVTSLDTDARTVTVAKSTAAAPAADHDNKGDKDSKDAAGHIISYHALIIASGVQTPSPLTTVTGAHTSTEEALDSINKRLQGAKSVIISGGGPTGVETAGEIGELLNGAAGCFASRPANPQAQITLITNAAKLLPVLRPALAKQAEKYLNRVGVDVIYNTKIESTSASDSAAAADGTTVTLSDGRTMSADVYIAAGGVAPNTAFVPAALRNEKGFVLANTATARVEAAGERVYVVGDASAATRGGLIVLDSFVEAMGSSLARDLGLASFPVKTFTPDFSESQLAPVGRNRGVGAFKGFRFPSWSVWLIKGRDYMIGMHIPSLINGSKYSFATA